MNPYKKYFVPNEMDRNWGLYISSIGYEDIKSNQPYPTKGHAPGYYFDITKGRVLPEYCLTYLVKGEGVLKTHYVDDLFTQKGDLYILYSNEWHTHFPKKKDGWQMYWIGFKGEIIDNLIEKGFFLKEEPLYSLGLNEHLVKLFVQAIEISKIEEIGSQQILAGITSQILGLIYSFKKNTQFLQTKTQFVECITMAKVYLNQEVENKISMKDLAARYNMSYSLFRKLFKEYTGFSPKQYFLELKLQQASILLSNTNLSVKEIAYKYNFLPDYFSYIYKKKMGYSPLFLRKKK